MISPCLEAFERPSSTASTLRLSLNIGSYPPLMLSVVNHLEGRAPRKCPGGHAIGFPRLRSINHVHLVTLSNSVIQRRFGGCLDGASSLTRRQRGPRTLKVQDRRHALLPRPGHFRGVMDCHNTPSSGLPTLRNAALEMSTSSCGRVDEPNCANHPDSRTGALDIGMPKSCSFLGGKVPG